MTTDPTMMHSPGSREDQIRQLDDGHVDVLIIGAGINGAVSAAALASRGAKVAVIDRGDFAGFTSQESSNLVWGGFKYLQTYEFGLVRKLCVARNRLVDSFPSSITPVDFVAVFDDKAPFPTWLASLGSYAYWAIGNFHTKPPRPMTTAQVTALEPVVNAPGVKGALRYADAYLQDNDARFAFGFVRSALANGAIAANYTSLDSARQTDTGDWEVALTDQVSGRTLDLRARTIVNATGPFIDEMSTLLDVETEHRIALSKGIHLVVPRIGTGENVLAFFDEDERLYYVIPMGDRSVIGTTDTKADQPHTSVTDVDRDFVLRQVNRRLSDDVNITAEDIIAERSGVRPLVVAAGSNDASADPADTTDWLQLSRKHEIEVSTDRRVVSVFGGKLTDCLNVGEEVGEAIESLGVHLAPEHDGWFGESPAADRDRFVAAARSAGMTNEAHIDALWRRYDTQAHELLSIDGRDDLITTTPPYSSGEITWMAQHEMIVTTEDFIRRRSHLALTTPADELAEVRGSIDAALQHHEATHSAC